MSLGVALGVLSGLCSSVCSLSGAGVGSYTCTQGTFDPAKAKFDKTCLVLPEIDYPPQIEGVVGRYTHKSFDADETVWKDISGNKNHVTELTGDGFEVKDGLVTGSVNETVLFPEVWSEDYTVAYVGKYHGLNKGRILTSGEDDVNWLAGFHDGNVGVSYHGDDGGWLTEEAMQHQALACVVDRPDTIRVNGENRTNVDYVNGVVPSRVGINVRAEEKSDFAISEIWLFDKIISDADAKKLERYLMEKHMYPGDTNHYKKGKPEGLEQEDADLDIWEISGNPEYCRAKAAELKYDIFGHRNDTQECLFYNKTDDFQGMDGEGESPDIFTTGCAARGKKIKDGC